jgi:hypothetical protein
MRAEVVGWSIVGVVVVLITHSIFGWWLNSSAGVLATSLTLFVAGLVSAQQGSARDWSKGRALWAGTFLMMVGILMWTGPGTIWPIVLVIAAALTAGAICLGIVVGSSTKPALTRSRRAS